jgi:GTP-binding protein Era
LLNTIIGEEISITTSLPQTTRRNARGIYSSDALQLVFVDTPGIHLGKHVINSTMLKQALQALEDDVDLICYIVDLSRKFAEEEQMAVELVTSDNSTPVLLVFNKTDLVKDVDSVVDRYFKNFSELSSLPHVCLSAINEKCRELFLSAVDPFISEGPRFFSPEDITDSPLRFIAAEYIRKQIILYTSKEVPHSVFVEIESYREEADRHRVIATIHVETRGQRAIIVGRNGSVINRIKKAARNELKLLTGMSVSLSCHIKVTPRWRDNTGFLQRMGLSPS